MIEKIIEIGNLLGTKGEQFKYADIKLDERENKENYVEEIIFPYMQEGETVKGKLMPINKANIDLLIKKYYWIGNAKASNPKIRVTSNIYENVEVALPNLLKTIKNENSKLKQRISWVVDNFYEEIYIDSKKKFRIKDNKIDKIYTLDKSKAVKLYSLVIGDELISQNDEYLDLLNQMSKPKLSDYHSGFCSTCKRKTDVTSNTTKLQLKYYMTNKISFASDFVSFDKNFSMCRDCYESAINGENILMKNFQTKLGESLLIIPQGVEENPKTREVVDEIFRLTKTSINGKVEDFYDLKQYLDSLEKENQNTIMIDLLFFRKGNQFFKIKHLLQDITLFRIVEINRKLADCNEFISVLNSSVNLGTFYNLLSKKNPEIGMNYILNIFKDEAIKSKDLLNDFMQSERNYIHLLKKSKDESRFDFLKMIGFLYFLSRMELFKYNNNVLKHMNLDMEESPSRFEELTLKKMDLNDQKESLVRIGFLLAQVSSAQYRSGLTNSPILDKVNFNGMDIRAVQRLVTLLEEKMKQYKLYYKNNLKDLTNLNLTIAKNFEDWTLSNNENVFYIMAGYSISRAAGIESSKGEMSKESVLEE